MTTASLIAGNPPGPTLMVCCPPPPILKWIWSGPPEFAEALAWAMASLRDPGPVAAVVVTV